MRALRRFTGDRVVCQVGEQSIDGIVDSAERDILILVEARLITLSDSMSIDGRAVIPSGSIRWVQVA